MLCIWLGVSTRYVCKVFAVVSNCSYSTVECLKYVFTLLEFQANLDYQEFQYFCEIMYNIESSNYITFDSVNTGT